MRVSGAAPVIALLLPVLALAFHPEGVDHEADLRCHVCNASYYCLNGEQFDCPANSLAAVALADRISECVCNPGFLREGDVCSLGQPPAWYMYGNRSLCVHTRETIAAGASGHADCVCVPGFAGLPSAEAVQCEGCPADTFADAYNTSECVPCPAYASHNLTRRANVSACLCDPGYTGPDGGPCVACAAGTFKAEPGAAACGACGANQYSGAAATACADCHPNSSSLPASPGVEHCLCDPGFYPYAGACRMCHPGRFKNTTANEACRICTGNTFAAEEGATACVSCLLSSVFSTANPAEGGVRCQCVAGYTQAALNLTTPECAACPPDTFQPGQGQTSCELCDASARAPEASVTPLACLCNAGFADDSAHQCLVCAGGTYKGAAPDDARDTEPCDVCPVHSFSLPRSGRLADCLCDPGFSGPDGGPCAACAPGKFKPANGSAACEDCPLHSYSDAPASTTCVSCVDFLSSTGGITALPGQSASASCVCDVSRGFTEIVLRGARACSACQVGTYATDSGCRNCSGGTYADERGLIQCKQCPANMSAYDFPFVACQCHKGYKCDAANSFMTFKSNATACLCDECPAGTFKDYTGAASACQVCQAYSESIPASTTQDMCLCKRGYRQDGPTVCVACSAAKYTDTLDALVCTDCPADTYTPASLAPWDTRGDCSACAVCNQTTNPAFTDHYDAALGGNGCGLDQPSSCQACPAAASLFRPTTASQRNKGVRSCVCDAHFYGLIGTACTACPAGQVRPDFLNADTTLADCLCAPGFEPDPGAVNLCRQCPIGTYKTYTGDQNCSKCPDTLTTEKTGNANASACVCAPGFAFDGTRCGICPDNLYKTGFNLVQTCTTCSANSFGTQGGTGPLDCTCFFGFEPNATQCLPCPTGKYRNDSVNLGIAYAHFLASQEINLARACSAGGCTVTTNADWWAPDYPASAVTDGNLINFHHTNGGNPWTRIDLEQTVFVTRIRIYNRMDCCERKLVNFNLRLGDSPTHSNNPACASSQPTFTDYKDFSCILSGRYFSIDQPLAYLHLREIEIYGTKIPINPSLYQCQVCPLNTATNSTASHVCAACAAGKTTDGRTGQVECVCDVGTEPGADGVCQTCRGGTYKAASTDKYANRACVNCSACAANQQVATECNSTHNVTCRACQANSWSYAGRTLLDPCMCNAGYELQGELCVACPVGKARLANANNSIRCEVCGPGFANTSAQATCHPCSGICSGHCGQITYDFSRADINNLASWRSYATSIGATTSLNGYGYDGVFAYPEVGFFRLSLPSGYNNVQIDFYATYAGYVILQIDGVTKAQAFPGVGAEPRVGQIQTYTQDYVPGQILYLYEDGVIGRALKITLRRFCDLYVRHECNATRDVICQECRTCEAGFYANNTCGVSYGNDRLDTQCAVCPADFYCPGGLVSQAALPCPDNSKSAPGSDAIADCTCDPGFYRSGDLCILCPLDSYCPRGVFQPIACPAPGRTLYEGSAVRLDCHCPRTYFRDPPGAEESFNCSLCTRNDFCFNNSLYNCSDALMQSEPGSGFFENCTCVNRYYNNGSRCEDCNVDFACVGGRQHACPALEWTNRLTRQEACVCRPGFVRAGAECVPCSDDFFCDGSDDAQHPCPPSSLGRAATNVSECLCNATFEVVHSNNVSEPHACRLCPLHFFKDFVGNSPCLRCTRCLPAADSVWTRIVCDAAFDAMCDACTVCHDPAAADTPAEQWAGVGCQEFTDTVCANCTLCDYANEWEQAPCAETRDRECAAIQRARPCEVGQYAGNHSRTTDSECLPCAMNDTLYEGQRLHVYTSAGRRYDDAASCDIACRPFSRLRDTAAPALGCVSCETGNVLFKVFTQNDSACTFTCRAGYVRAGDDCVLPPLQPSASSFWNHSLSVTHVRRVAVGGAAAFRFTVSHTAHGSFAVVVGGAEPTCAGRAPLALRRRPPSACCFAGLWRVSTKNQLGLASSADETCSATNAPPSSRISDTQLEFDVPDARLTELALCAVHLNASVGELACVLHVSIVDAVLLHHFSVAVPLELRRGAALAFLPGAHTYVPVLSFHAEVQLAYLDAGQPVFLVVSDIVPLPAAGAVEVLLVSGLERVEPAQDANCDRYALNSSAASTTLWTLAGAPARATVFLRAPAGTTTLKLYYALRLLEREGEAAEPRNTMNVAVWRNVTLTHPVCERSPAALAVRLGEVHSCSGLGAAAVATATALREPSETVRGELGGLTSFVARALLAHVRSVHPAHMLAAFALPDAAPLLAANVTTTEGGGLDFSEAFAAACSASAACHLRYVYGGGVHYASSCDAAAQHAARAWLSAALGVVDDAGHVEALCARAQREPRYAFLIALVNTRAYMPRTAPWHDLQNKSAPQSTSRVYALFEFQ